MARLEAELRKLVPLVGCGDQLMTDRMADLKERIGQMERRLTEILRALGTLEDQAVDESDFRTALRHFGPVWESLTSREQALIIHTLIERVVYNGKTNRLTVRFRSAAIREMCRDAGKERANES